jgi:hypothetical protein
MFRRRWVGLWRRSRGWYKQDLLYSTVAQGLVRYLRPCHVAGGVAGAVAGLITNFLVILPLSDPDWLLERDVNIDASSSL